MRYLFFTIHPAPYLDRLNKSSHDIVYLYLNRKDRDKNWSSEFGSKSDIYWRELSYVRMIKIIKTSDRVILSGWNNWRHFFILYFLAILFRKEIFFFSDLPENIHSSRMRNKLKRLVLSKCDRILCASVSCVDYFESNYQHKDVVLFPYMSNESKVASREKCGSGKKLLVANRFLQRKGYATLLPALEKALSIHDDLVVNIIGDGPELELFKKRYSHLFNFLGWVEHEVYVNMLNDSNIYVHASYFEPFGIPPVDAYACGLNVLVSDGVQSFNMNKVDWISQGVYRYKAEDVNELINCLNMALTNNNVDLHSRQKTFNKYFDIEVIEVALN